METAEVVSSDLEEAREEAGQRVEVENGGSGDRLPAF